jgi:hypothetical protein
MKQKTTKEKIISALEAGIITAMLVYLFYLVFTYFEII